MPGPPHLSVSRSILSWFGLNKKIQSDRKKDPGINPQAPRLFHPDLECCSH